MKYVKSESTALKIAALKALCCTVTDLFIEIKMSMRSVDVGFDLKVGQIGLKWDKNPGLFRSDFMSFWLTVLKKSRICPI